MKFLQGQKLLQHIEAMVMTLRVPTIAVTALIGLGTMHLIIKKILHFKLVLLLTDQATFAASFL